MEENIKIKVSEIKFIYKVILYIMFGILWSLSNIGYSFAFLTWFALIPFLFSIKYEDFKNGIIFSIIFGSSAYLFHFWWIANPIGVMLSIDYLPKNLSFLSWIIAIFLTLLISFYHGLSYTLIYIIIRFISTKKGNLFYIVSPFVITVIDFFYPKLWYDQIGYSQYVFISFSQIAEIFGVPFITFILICCNASTLLLIESILRKKDYHIYGSLFLFIIFLVVIFSIFGNYRKNQIKEYYSIFDKAKIGIVQGNFTGLDKRFYSKINLMIDTYNDLSKSLLDQSPDLIIWPESAIPIYFDVNTTRFDAIKKFNGVPLLFGCHIVDNSNNLFGEKVYNSLVLVSKDNYKIDSYYKIKLLPFIEQFPLEFLSSLMNFYGLKSFTKGKDFKIMSLNNINMTTNICYEAIIPDFIRKSLKTENKQANLIVNATNDSWFGNTIEPKMHLHITGFRAIENRRSIVRVTCTGYSAVFDPTGNLTYISPLFKKDSVVKDVYLFSMSTFFNKGGWFFVYFLGILLILFILYALYRRTKYNYFKKKIIYEKQHRRKLRELWLS